MSVAPLLHVAARVIITTDPPMWPPILVENLTGQGLRLDWQVDKMRGPDPDSVSLTIYNLATVSRALLSAAWAAFAPTIISLYIGWGGLPELVFKGDAWHMVPERVEGTDIITTIQARDGGLALRDTPPSGSTGFSLGVQLAVAQILGQMGLTPSSTAMAAIGLAAGENPVAATIQHIDADEPREALDILLASVGLAWGIADGMFVVYRGGLRNDVLPAILAPKSGLLNWRVADDGGVEFEALAQAGVVPGCQVTINGPTGEVIGGGPLRIDEIRFGGSTEGLSTMTGVARKVVLL